MKTDLSPSSRRVTPQPAATSQAAHRVFADAATRVHRDIREDATREGTRVVASASTTEEGMVELGQAASRAMPLRATPALLAATATADSRREPAGPSAVTRIAASPPRSLIPNLSLASPMHQRLDPVLCVRASAIGFLKLTPTAFNP